MDNILLTGIREWVTFAADICVLLITIYTFYITFICKKVDAVSFDSSFNLDNGEKHSITIVNKKMAPIIITRVRLIIDEEYLLELPHPKEPIVIDGFGVKTINTGNYGYLEPEISVITGNNIIEVTLYPNKKILVGSKKRYKYYFDKNIKKLKCVKMVTNKFNDKIIPKGAKYIIVAKEKNKQENITAFVFKTGVMTASIMGANGIPESVVGDINTLDGFLHEWLDKYNVRYYLTEIGTMSIDEDTLDSEDNGEDGLPIISNFSVSSGYKIE